MRNEEVPSSGMMGTYSEEGKLNYHEVVWDHLTPLTSKSQMSASRSELQGKVRKSMILRRWITNNTSFTAGVL